MERVTGSFTAQDDPPRGLSHGRLRLSPLQRIATAGLVMTAIVVLVNVYQFALTRFFTIDEYQWGHATWLIREGKVPYRDFYDITCRSDTWVTPGCCLMMRVMPTTR